MIGKKCEYCERTFAKNQQLIRHRRAHTGEQPFRCRICGKRFSRRDVLVRHDRGHSRGHILIGPRNDPISSPPAHKGRAQRATESSEETGNEITLADAHSRETYIYDTDRSIPSLSQQFESSGCQPPASEDSVFIHALTTTENRSTLGAVLGTNAYSSNNHPNVDINCISAETTDARETEDFEALLSDTLSACTGPTPIPAEAAGDALEGVDVEYKAAVSASFWPTTSPHVSRLTRTLWKDVAFAIDGNLFSRICIPSMPPDSNITPLSRSGLEEESQKELRILTERLIPHTCLNELAENVNFQVPKRNSYYFGVADLSSKCWACQGSSGLLDLGLDLYIRMFQPVMPMLHVPTFKPEEIPTLLLLLMCLLGLTFVNTEEATEFVQMAFLAVLDTVYSELSAGSHRKSNAEIISLLATSVHMMCLIIMTGGTRNIEQCQMLHVQTLTTAQQHGLFTAQCAGILDNSIFEHITDADKKWEAWSRIESTKRVIVGLVLGDAWFSEFFSSAGPVIRTEHMNILLPCDRDLFQAANARDWMQLMKLRPEKPLSPIVLCPGGNRLPVLRGPVDPYAMYGVLFSILLNVLEKLCCLLPSTEPSEVLQHQCIPWKMYAAQSSTGAATSLVARVIETYDSVLQDMSPHCIVIWHYTVIKLTADKYILECAAGREGANPANQALEAIRAWSQTPSARRACLHAAQIFKALSNRRPQDATSFLSIPSLFLAALVLALYLLAAPSPFGSQDVPDVFELISDIDWNEVGDGGLVESSAGSDTNAATSASAARKFIRFGGLVSINGVIYSGGVQNAQRILLEFACLLDDIPKFKIGEHLRIMYQVINFLSEGGATGYFSLTDDIANLPVNSFYGILSY